MHSAELDYPKEEGHQLHSCPEEDLCFERGRISIFLQPHCSFYTAARSCQPCLAFLVWSVWSSESQHAPFFFFNYLTMPTANQRAEDHDTDWREGPWYRDREIDWYKTSSLKVKLAKSKREGERQRTEGVKWEASSCHSMLLSEVEVMCLMSDLMSAVSGRVTLWWHSQNFSGSIKIYIYSRAAAVFSITSRFTVKALAEALMDSWYIYYVYTVYSTCKQGQRSHLCLKM